MTTQVPGQPLRKTLMLMEEAYDYISRVAEKSSMGRHIVVETMAELVDEAALLRALSAKRARKEQERAQSAAQAIKVKELTSKLSVEQLEQLLKAMEEGKLP